jgi:undecaprenyl-diphosphatase
MHWLHALILGIVQGLTEFFPISSSAHLKIVKEFLGIEGNTVLFDLFCHMGTFIALLIYFRNAIYDLLFRTQRRLILFIVALLPLIPFYFLLKPIREALSQSQYLGFCLIATACILFLASHFVLKAHRTLSVKDAIWIGTLQGVALIPGISRSAATIGTGLWRGVSAAEAVQFSFLLSLPAIGGGTVLELMKAKSHLAAMPASLSNCFIGFFASAIVGFFTVKIAIPLLQRGILRPFAWYCLIAGIAISIFVNHG